MRCVLPDESIDSDKGFTTRGGDPVVKLFLLPIFP